MWNKIFLTTLGLSILVLALLGYFSWSWLQSIGNPAVAAQGYAYYSRIGLIMIFICSAFLLLLANGVLARTRSAWAMWTVFAFFAIFVLIRSFGLEPAFLRFKESNYLSDSSFSIAPFVGVLLCLAAAVVIYINQYVVVRLTDRMYPSKTQTSEDLDSEQASDNLGTTAD